MLAILQDLHEEDHFALVLFDHRISPWKPTLIKATKENVTDAMNFIRKITTNGG